MKWLNTLTGGYGSLVVYAAVALAIAASYGWTYHKGYSASTSAWSLKYDQREAAITAATNAEISRQAQANAQAKAIEAARIAQLEAENAALEQLIKEKSDEADADPDRDRPALSGSAGMRIDAVH